MRGSVIAIAAGGGHPLVPSFMVLPTMGKGAKQVGRCMGMEVLEVKAGVSVAVVWGSIGQARPFQHCYSFGWGGGGHESLGWGVLMAMAIASKTKLDPPPIFHALFRLFWTFTPIIRSSHDVY